MKKIIIVLLVTIIASLFATYACRVNMAKHKVEGAAKVAAYKIAYSQSKMN